jgi:intergrase/recombinase
MMKNKEDCPPEVTKAMKSIKEKMLECKIGDLHPPFLPKTVTKYRHEYFMPLKREYIQELDCKDTEKFKAAIRVLSSFVSNFDCEVMDDYL